jgi:hypothetical protein
MITIEMKRKEIAELGGIILQCGSVSYNEHDNRSNYFSFKKKCGVILNEINEYSHKWNDEAIEKFKIPEDLMKKLEEYDKKASNCKSEEELIKLQADNEELLKEEEKYGKMLESYHGQVVSVSLTSIPEAIVPLNINGPYLNKIECLIGE